jgi:hypothetical protein
MSLNKQMKTGLSYIIFLFVGLVSCKKYPENTLWFKNPEKLLPFFDTHLTKYSVNGIDSLDLLNNYFGNQQGLEKDIRKALFKTLRYSSHNDYFIFFEPSSYNMQFSYEFFAKNKKIRFIVSSEPTILTKIFLLTRIPNGPFSD